VEISTKVRRAPVPTVQLVEDHMERLNQWYWELPPMMQLAGLYSGFSEIFSHFQKRSILLVHMQSLNAIVLLHRPLLGAIAKSQLAGTWAFDSTVQKYIVYQEYCVVAAQQASRIAAILQLDRKMPKHCWMTM
jgi:hypothetical protein